ncbi:MAG: GNAT family N-acetyltransferase, partial [Alphaproteobacteria bacterium]
PMVRRPRAHELILGVASDPQFGPVILFGHGGVAVEVIRDRALALPPLNLTLARELISRTRVARLLAGYRGQPPAALDAIALALVKVAQLAAEMGELVELDVNPLIADEAGVVALDARILVRRFDGRAADRLAIRPYPQELETPVSAAGGRLLLRPIRPEDEPALQRAFARLDPEDIRLRFFAPLKALTHRLAARLTQIDYDREMALVLAEPGAAGTAELFGVARLHADPDNVEAEFAVTVRSDMKGRGLGRLLMDHLIAHARRRGLKCLFGHVLAENAPMLALCRDLGFALVPETGEPGVVRVTLALARAGTP